MVNCVVSEMSGGSGWWQASDGRRYSPEQRPGPPPPPPRTPSREVEDRPERWTWALLVGGLVLGAIGIVRLLLDVSATVLGTSISCGNPVGWLSSNEPASHTAAGSVCQAPLHNASLEGVGALVVGGVLLIAWLLAVRATWPLTVLVVFLAFVAVALAGQPLAALVVAVVVVVGSAAWRTLERRRVKGKT